MQENIKRYSRSKVSNYDKYPFVQVTDEKVCIEGWEPIFTAIKQKVDTLTGKKALVVVECYQGVHHDELRTQLKNGLNPDLFIDASESMLPEKEIDALVAPYLTDDPVFGYITDLTLDQFFSRQKLEVSREKIEKADSGLILVYGCGASLLAPAPDLLIYADMARWEIQQRMRRNEVGNLGVNNQQEAFAYQYKRGFFVDWRLCDRWKRTLMQQWDYVLDTHIRNHPKMVAGKEVLKGLEKTANRPFRVVPFFDPGVWGGQWMKEVLDLDRFAVNYAWGFDCVPEENSLLLGFGNCRFEIPSINLVFYQSVALLGEKVQARFGDEFPIRFDFLDTMDGGNLSLQVHPDAAYIRENFGMPYTQDESYYMLDVEEDAFVYLGLKEGVNPAQMIADLAQAQNGGAPFDADKHVKKWPVKKHDHVLIPAGTVHCSGRNSMVLEISATPYIFTFKLWDWNRLGLDGKPRPIFLDHGKAVIQWDWTEARTKKEILNRTELLSSGNGWREERTGLHELEFIETRRHWFTKPVPHHTRDGVNVLNLVEGWEAIVESPTQAFEPLVVHYAETFIVPAAVGAYTIRPYGEGEGMECATIKAFVRT